MKERFYLLIGLIGLLVFSGCGEVRNIPIQEFKPEHIEQLTLTDNVSIKLNHSQQMISDNDSLHKGLKDYLATYAPSFKLVTEGSSDSSDLTLDLFTKRKGILVTADVELRTRLFNRNGLQILRSSIFPSQQCSRSDAACLVNERYNIGLYSGNLLLESISEQYQTFLSMYKANTIMQQKQFEIEEEANQEKDLEHKQVVEQYLASNDYQGLKTYTDDNPNAVYFIQSKSMRLMFTGPKGMKVGDILKLVKEGRSETIVVSLIKRVNTPYKEFALDEIDTLSNMGLSDVAISAMIDVTTELLKDKERRKEQEFLLHKLASQNPDTPYEATSAHNNDNSLAKSVTNEMTKQGVKLLLNKLF